MDLGAAIQGGLGFAASGNIWPDRSGPSTFDPAHGSAPDIAGKNIANPIAAIWSAAMMSNRPGEATAAATIMAAIELTTESGIGIWPGNHSTSEIVS